MTFHLYHGRSRLHLIEPVCAVLAAREKLLLTCSPWCFVANYIFFWFLATHDPVDILLCIVTHKLESYLFMNDL